MPYIQRCRCCCATGFAYVSVDREGRTPRFGDSTPKAVSTSQDPCAFEPSSSFPWSPFTFGYDHLRDRMMVGQLLPSPGSPVRAYKMRLCALGEIPFINLMDATTSAAVYDDAVAPYGSYNLVNPAWIHADATYLYGHTWARDFVNGVYNYDVWRVLHDGSGFTNLVSHEFDWSSNFGYLLPAATTIMPDGDVHTATFQAGKINFYTNGAFSFSDDDLDDQGLLNGGSFWTSAAGTVVFMHTGASQFWDLTSGAALEYGDMQGVGATVDPLTGALYLFWAPPSPYGQLIPKRITVHTEALAPGEVSVQPGVKFLPMYIGPSVGNDSEFLGAVFRNNHWPFPFSAGGPCGGTCPECGQPVEPEEPCVDRVVIQVDYNSTFWWRYEVLIPADCECTWVETSVDEDEVCIEVTCWNPDTEEYDVLEICEGLPDEDWNCCDCLDTGEGVGISTSGWSNASGTDSNGVTWDIDLAVLNTFFRLFEQLDGAGDNCVLDYRMLLGESGDYDAPGLLFATGSDGTFDYEDYLFEVNAAMTCDGEDGEGDINFAYQRFVFDGEDLLGSSQGTILNGSTSAHSNVNVCGGRFCDTLTSASLDVLYPGLLINVSIQVCWTAFVAVG